MHTMAAVLATRTSSNVAQTTATRLCASHRSSSANRQPSSLRQSTSRTQKTRATLPTSPGNGAMCARARLASQQQLCTRLTSPFSAGTRFVQLRTKLDYTYHKVPSKKRQLLQDSLIENILQIRTNECRACHENHEHPQVLFTAGAMASGKGHTLRHFLKEGEISLPSNFIWCGRSSPRWPSAWMPCTLWLTP